MSMWDSQELFLAEFIVYIGLRHAALSTTAHLSGDFSRRWCSDCVKDSPAWFFEIFAEFKLDFICCNLCFAANPISTLCGFFLIFLFNEYTCIKLYRFDFFFRILFFFFTNQISNLVSNKRNHRFLGLEASYKRIKFTGSHFRKREFWQTAKSHWSYFSNIESF